jgi:ribonuclease P protein component
MAKTRVKGPTGILSRVVTLKRRSEFQRIRKGARWATPAFVIEARQRGDEERERASPHPRFGFTITRNVGKAVERNRVRRRLKAAVMSVQGDHARQDFDYVLIARRSALEAAFAALVSDLATALDRVNKAAMRARRGDAARPLPATRTGKT